MAAIIEKGPETITIRGKKVPEWFVDEFGRRYEFDSMAVLDRDGGFEMSQLAENQSILAPGAIYERKGNWKQLTAEGQLTKGDKIKIVGKSDSDSQTITVKEVIDVDGHEEVIINKRKNRYFINNMVLGGTSWAKSVTKIS